VSHDRPQDEPPAAERRSRAWIISSYFAEGLPYSIVHQVITTELLTSLGASLTAIGLTSLYHLPWNFKLLWAPWVERRGTTRAWIVATEALLAALVLVAAFPAQRGDLIAVAGLTGAIAIVAATQDIAVDGFYLRALDAKGQATYSGARVAAYRVAMLLGKGGLVWLAGVTSWLVSLAAAGMWLAALAAFHQAALPRVERAPAPGARRASFIAALRSFLARPGAGLAIAFILVFRAGDALLFAMSSPLLKDLGLDTAARGFWSGTVGTFASIGGSILGGIVIGRFGLARALFPIALVQGLAILLYVWLAWARPELPAIAAVLIVEQLVAGVGTSAFSVFLMRCSSGEDRVSHFAIATAIMSVAATLAGSASGWLAAELGFTRFFAVAFAASLPGVALARLVGTDAPAPAPRDRPGDR
jgi:PAT family beta-lactamase induction signal transducer AmpG